METIAEFLGSTYQASDVYQMVKDHISEAAKSEGFEVDTTSVNVTGVVYVNHFQILHQIFTFCLLMNLPVFDSF